MGTCNSCRERSAELFSKAGEPVCRVCFYAADAAEAEKGIIKSLRRGGIGAIVFGVVLLPLAFVARRLAALPALLIAGGISCIAESRRRARLNPGS